MELNTIRRDVEMGGVQQSTNFSLKSTAHAFDVLSNLLYTDKIGAVVRELSCNAWDSHVAAGKADVPIYVKLPSSMDPVFEVTDEGVGLTDEEVRTIFTRYFESTKNETNSQIGGLGLGCKSPFAYVDAFVVIATKDGITSKYAATIGEGGVPNINRVSKQKTDLPNGVTVSLGVKTSDIDAFVEAAQSKLKYFFPRPQVTGNSSYEEPEESEVMVSGDGWRVFKSEHTHSYSRHGKKDEAYAIMGNVAYPIDSNHIDLKFHKEILELPIEIDFPIGTLGIAASRKGLSYDKRTTKALSSKLTDIKNALRKNMEAKLTSCSDYYEAWRTYYVMYHSSNSLRSVLRSLNVTYKGKDILSSIYTDCVCTNIGLTNSHLPNPAFHLTSTTSHLSKAVRITFKNERTFLYANPYANRSIAEDEKQDIFYWINSDLDKAIVGPNVRILHDLRTNHKKIIEKQHAYNIKKLECSAATLKKLKAYYGDSLLIKDVSTLPKPEAKTEVKGGVILYKYDYGWRAINPHRRTNTVPDSYFIWFGADRLSISPEDTALVSFWKSSLTRAERGVWHDKLYAVSKGSLKAIKAHPKAIHIKDFLKALVRRTLKNTPIISSEELARVSTLSTNYSNLSELYRSHMATLYFQTYTKEVPTIDNHRIKVKSTLNHYNDVSSEFLSKAQEIGLMPDDTPKTSQKKLQELDALLNETTKLVDKYRILEYIDYRELTNSNFQDQDIPRVLKMVHTLIDTP